MFLRMRTKNTMKNLCDDMPNGYLESIEKGMRSVRYFGRNMSYGKGTKEEQIIRLRKELQNADAVIIGAGAGLSTSAGFVYSGERFEKWLSDYAKKYGFKDMYSGGFYPYSTKEEFWAYWARYIYINRYLDAPKPVYDELYELVKDKDYFVITTNVDHCFQKAGFNRKRLFYTQGDYGLFQSVNPDIQKTYDNEEWVMKAMEAQGFVKNAVGVFEIPDDQKPLMTIPSELIPKCPDDGSDMTTNLRADDSFVENEGWHRASAAYSDFIRRHENLHVLYLELGVGGNTPVIIKYPFWQMTWVNDKAVYACINYGEAFCPGEIEDRSICIDGDIGAVLQNLRKRDHGHSDGNAYG